MRRGFLFVGLASMTVIQSALCSKVFAQGVFSVTVTSGTGTGSLYAAIVQAETYGNGAVINIANNLGTINVGQLPDINLALTINGGTGNTLSGQNANRIFFINAPGQAVQINNLTLSNGLAQGGNGGSGGGAGGGGAGLGGAVFINSGNVIFSSVAFTNNTAKGGSGGGAGIGGGGGGGGMGLAGGNGSDQIVGPYLLGAGGGGGAKTTSGYAASGLSAGHGGGVFGGAAGPTGAGNDDGQAGIAPDGGGGGGGFDNSPYNTVGITVAGKGGNGNDFGGGGGAGSSQNNYAGNGGYGGFGGGGGGGADAGGGPGGPGGNGGFGGGGGGAGGSPNTINYGPSEGGTGGYGGGDGGFSNEGAGGGGAAFGGAVFVRSGSVNFVDSSADAGTITPGSGGISGTGHNGTAGSAAGGSLFLMGGNTTFTVSAVNTETIAGSIAQSATSSITKDGPGTLVLSAANSYTGGTTVTAGTLRLPNLALPGTSATVGSQGILEYNDSSNLTHPMFSYTGTGTLRKTGAGTLIFGGLGNVNVNFSAGSLIDVQEGTLIGTSSYQGVWANNQASLNITSGATFDAVEGGPTGTMQIDALLGSGAFRGGYFGAFNATTTATIGVAGGSGIFSGSISDDSGAHLAIVKAGAGTQTFSGSNTYTGGTAISDGTLAIGAVGALPTGSAVVNNASLIFNANSSAGSITGTGTTSVAAGVALNAVSFSQGSGIAMQLGGSTASANSKLAVAGALSESGSLTVSLANNFRPIDGDSFDLLDWGIRSGNFSSVLLPTLSGRIVWNSSQLNTTGSISVIATYYVGDYNRDGHVNAADILVAEQAFSDISGYQTAHGLTDPTLFNLVADVNGDGQFNSADLQDLLEILKNGDGSADPVPEPSTAALLTLGSLFAFTARRR